jgi:Smr domain
MPMSALKTLNIEAGLPTVDEARRLLLTELHNAKQSGVIAVKIIHGYGSTGKGGALRGALRSSLLRRKKEGLVSRVIFGENWSVFEEDARYAIERCPELSHDRDLNRSNEGITLAILV